MAGMGLGEMPYAAAPRPQGEERRPDPGRGGGERS